MVGTILLKYKAYAMKTTVLIGISQIVLSILLLSIPCSSQETSKQGKENHKSPPRGLRLSLSIRADRSEYRIGDVLRMETQLTNAGEDTLFLFDDVCWNPGNSLSIHVLDVWGKEVSGHSDFLRDCLPPPPAHDDITRLFKLEPGTFYGVVNKFDICELVPGPGAYSVVVHYLSGISKDWISEFGGEKMTALPVWTSDDPELSSNRLHIVVKP
jgi:hypothetical protein